jgi:hypothetical protein
MPSADENGIARALANRFPLPCPIPFNRPNVGEANVRIERIIIAALVSVLALFAVEGTAAADEDGSGMTHNGTEMTHN